MILYLDTKDQKRVVVELKENGKVVKSLSEENEYGSQVLLPMVMKLLLTTPVPLRGARPGKYELKTLTGIEVETGPGSFTGLKVGVSVANALGFSLSIPVNGKKIEDKLVY